MTRLLLALMLCIPRGGAAACPMDIIGLGDSVVYMSNLALYTLSTTRGWHAYWNYGISGETSAQILARTPTALLRDPDYVWLDGGLNDLVHAVTTETYLANMESILALIDAAGATPILMLISPDTGVSNTLMQLSDAWNAALTTIASGYGAIVIDVRPVLGVFRVGGDPGNLWDGSPITTYDGVHPSAAGCIAIADVIATVVP